MSKVRVISGHNSFSDIDVVAIECPFCHAYVTPQYIYKYGDYIFAECTNTRCRRPFVLANQMGLFNRVLPNSEPSKKSFSDIIRGISPSFDKIYNQAYIAEQIGLNQICGVGYRKALEFLIKDYLISGSPDENYKERVKNKFLSNCIKEDVSNTLVKIVAERAAWLGNDETHYTRIWQDKDVSHLKQLIDLTVRWIENEVETQQLLEEMPEKK